LVVLDRNAEQNASSAKSIDASAERVVPMVVDVRDRPAIDCAVAGGIDRWGRIDVLVNNAGFTPVRNSSA
jgi:NADP-dependent 3-hydroxy acid dehydrogenase YdfG